MNLCSWLDKTSRFGNSATDQSRKSHVMCAVVSSPDITSLQSTLIAALLLTVATLFSEGCAMKQAYFGHGGTDLSSLQPGVSRTAIEKVTGPPERIEQYEGIYLAWYVYDIGYSGPLEMKSTPYKIFMVPVGIFAEVTSLGLIEVANASYGHCEDACQKGLLEVCYDTSDSMLSATESVLPESHSLLDGCSYNCKIYSTYLACVHQRRETGGDDPAWSLDSAAGTYCPNADLGHADAQLAIANIYNHGVYGRNFDPVRAWVWYSLAAQGGNAQAAKLLPMVAAELSPDQQAEAIRLLAAWQPGQCVQQLVPEDWGQSLANQYPSTISASTCLAWQAEKEQRERRNSH